MTIKLKDFILKTAKDIFESQSDEPLTQEEVEDMLLEFSELLIKKYEDDRKFNGV